MRTKLQKEAMEKTKEWIIKECGERCNSLSHGCTSCDKWVLFDILFADWDAEYTWSREIKEPKKDDKALEKLFELCDKLPKKFKTKEEFIQWVENEY